MAFDATFGGIGGFCGGGGSPTGRDWTGGVEVTTPCRPRQHALGEAGGEPGEQPPLPRPSGEQLHHFAEPPPDDRLRERTKILGISRWPFGGSALLIIAWVCGCRNGIRPVDGLLLRTSSSRHGPFSSGRRGEVGIVLANHCPAWGWIVRRGREPRGDIPWLAGDPSARTAVVPDVLTRGENADREEPSQGCVSRETVLIEGLEGRRCS